MVKDKNGTGKSLYGKFKGYLKSKLSISKQMRLRIFVANLLSVFIRNDLNKLGKLYGTDKIGSHFYTPHYMTHLKKLKNKRINLLEIGVGGYDNPNIGGNSLRMWKKYFPFGNIFGLDIYDKSALQERRIKIFQGSQIDNNFLKNAVQKISGIDIIIDDGSHINEHIIETFKILFPILKDGRIYVVEDIQTSYWPNYGGDSKNLNNSHTAMNFFKGLTDCLNYEEFMNQDYEATYYDKKIVAMYFYHNMVFICKGNNNEKSNCVNIMSQKNGT